MIPRAASCVISSRCFLIFVDANFVPNIEELNCCEQRGHIKETRTLFVLEIISNTSNQLFLKIKTAKKFIKKTSKQMFHVRRYHVSFFAFHLFLVEFYRNVKNQVGGCDITVAPALVIATLRLGWQACLVARN